MAAIPIVVLFVLLAGIRTAAQCASLITLAVAFLIAYQRSEEGPQLVP